MFWTEPLFLFVDPAGMTTDHPIGGASGVERWLSIILGRDWRACQRRAWHLARLACEALAMQRDRTVGFRSAYSRREPQAFLDRPDKNSATGLCSTDLKPRRPQRGKFRHNAPDRIQFQRTSSAFPLCPAYASRRDRPLAPAGRWRRTGKACR